VNWELDEHSVRHVYPRFLARNPSAETKASVDSALMDIVEDPLEAGREDEGQLGVFHLRVSGHNVGILYTVDVDHHRIYLADIGPP
jgi:hypothetical protein